MASPALAAVELGGQVVGSDVLHDPPTVDVTAPSGVVTSGGPVLTVQWSYSQPQGDPQEWYRVLAQNDARTVTYYDSGWIKSTAQQLAVDVDAENIPADTTDLTWVVQVRGPEQIGTGDVARYQAEDASPIDLQWGVPHCTILQPTDQEVVTTPGSITVSWSFSDDRAGKTQGWYRVYIRYRDSQQTVYDTGWVASADTSVTLPVELLDGSAYDVVVQLKNNEGIRSD